MPVTYEINADAGVILVRAYGAVTPVEFHTNRVKLQDDPENRPGLKYLVDLRDVQRFAMSADDIERLADDRTSHFIEPGTPLAIVADSDEGFGLSRMYQIMRGTAGEEIQVFSNIEGAEAWLALQPRTETRPTDD